MPIFSYECTACHHKFDELVKGSEKIVCPACGSAKLEKLMSAFAVSSGGPSSCETGDTGGCPSGGCCSGGTCGLH